MKAYFSVQALPLLAGLFFGVAIWSRLTIIVAV